ncbi:DUF4249 domain-containing protein [Sunxiuqinia indica]|uniref:DUF4249 domain-containing protein n=1 Tax=Sunxiuqinia indica TaxID=2692584 RepID=UPI0013572CB3|nr:DUF4249 domain-containing protein [Sunxiuqinia indica]
MQITKALIYFVLIGIALSSCIERYYLDSDRELNPRLVVDATITNDGGEQKIVISWSADPEFAIFQPVSGCVVRVEDKQGNQLYFNESTGSGEYRAIIGDQYLRTGSEFRLLIDLPDGEQYVSRFEKMLPCPPIESVYYELESKPTNDPNINEEGAQFYIDLNAGDSYGRFFRWKLQETWEYHSSFPITRYLDEEGWHNYGEDYSFYTCYRTEDIKKLFLLSTRGLKDNSYEMFPLHFVNDHTQRLKHQYSLLVKQYSLTEEAWSYWEKLRKNNQESVDMFGKQPVSVRGNIFNAKDSLETALGYFSVSSVSSKRIQVDGIEDLHFYELPVCAVTLEKDMEELPDEDDFPAYFTQVPDENQKLEWGYANSGCFICTMHGGTLEKPSYWE